MTNNLLDRAKEIFFKYATSTFQMMRDGLHAEYSSYNVSKEQEMLWTNELIDREIKNLNINDKTTLFPLSYVLQTNCMTTPLDKIIDFILDNVAKADNSDKILAFIEKTHDILDSLEQSCESISILTEQYKRRLSGLKL